MPLATSTRTSSTTHSPAYPAGAIRVGTITREPSKGRVSYALTPHLRAMMEDWRSADRQALLKAKPQIEQKFGVLYSQDLKEGRTRAGDTYSCHLIMDPNVQVPYLWSVGFIQPRAK